MLTKELGKQTELPRASWRDYYALTKPRVVQLLVFTAIIGMFLATPGMVPWDVLIFGSLGIGQLCLLRRVLPLQFPAPERSQLRALATSEEDQQGQR